MRREESRLRPTKLTLVLLLTGVLTSAAGRTPAGAAAPVDLNDRGIFQLYLNGLPVGTENFEIRPVKDGVEARAEIHLRVEQNGKALEEKTYPELFLDPKLAPVSYTWSQKGSQSSGLQADFRSSPVKTRYKTINGQEDKRDFRLPPDVIILDDNVVHHYQIVVDRYRLTPGGKQVFHAFIPQEALPGDLTVEDVGAEDIQIGGTSLHLHHLVVTAELAHVDLWVDDQQHLQRISIADAHFEAVRQK